MLVTRKVSQQLFRSRPFIRIFLYASFKELSDGFRDLGPQGTNVGWLCIIDCRYRFMLDSTHVGLAAGEQFVANRAQTKDSARSHCGFTESAIRQYDTTG